MTKLKDEHIHASAYFRFRTNNYFLENEIDTSPEYVGQDFLLSLYCTFKLMYGCTTVPTSCLRILIVSTEVGRRMSTVVPESCENDGKEHILIYQIILLLFRVYAVT